MADLSKVKVGDLILFNSLSECIYGPCALAHLEKFLKRTWSCTRTGQYTRKNSGTC
jgi:hypothetical protein